MVIHARRLLSLSVGRACVQAFTWLLWHIHWRHRRMDWNVVTWCSKQDDECLRLADLADRWPRGPGGCEYVTCTSAWRVEITLRVQCIIEPWLFKYTVLWNRMLICHHSLTVKICVGWIRAGYVEFSSAAATLCDVVDNGAGRNVS